ncbi:MAG: hypothetical protein M3Q07_14680 [Pseudobdellovibrionaceae bacterium]|nr:hypothetical protein [Pseudobdellovibrionaceae bacterium]
MQSAVKSVWILVFTIAALSLGHCGRKSGSSKDDETQNIPYIPTTWDGEEDWSGNALQVEDIP